MCRGVIAVARDDFSIPVMSAAADCVENTITLNTTQQQNVLASQLEMWSYNVVLQREVTLRALWSDTTQVFQIH